MKHCRVTLSFTLVTVLFTALFALSAFANGLPTHSQLQASLKAVVEEGNGGFDLNMLYCPSFCTR